MTAPHSSLVEQVQNALVQADVEFHGNSAIPHRSRHLAQAAVAAIRAEETLQALSRLLTAIGSQPVRVFSGDMEGAISEALKVLDRVGT